MISPQDYDRLSALMDNQLSPAEKAALGERLAREAELRSALEDLRLNRRLLRALPVVKPPRSFTLTEAQAQAIARRQERRPGGLFGSLRLASAFAAVLLVAAVVGDFGGGLFLAQPAAAPAVSQAEKGAAAGESGLEPPAADALETPTPAATLVMEMAAPALAPTGGPEMMGAAAAETATAGPSEDAARSQASETAPAAEGLLTSAPTATPPPTSTPAAVAELSGQADGAAGTLSAPPPSIPWIRYLEAGLAMLVAVLGALAWLVRPSGRR